MENRHVSRPSKDVSAVTLYAWLCEQHTVLNCSQEPLADMCGHLARKLRSAMKLYDRAFTEKENVRCRGSSGCA